MITKIILKGERNKVCKKKKKKWIFKIPIIYFLPITKINNSSKISTYANFGHLMQSWGKEGGARNLGKETHIYYLCQKNKVWNLM